MDTTRPALLNQQQTHHPNQLLGRIGWLCCVGVALAAFWAVVFTHGAVRASCAAVLAGSLVILCIHYRRHIGQWEAMSEKARKRFLGDRWDD